MEEKNRISEFERTLGVLLEAPSSGLAYSFCFRLITVYLRTLDVDFSEY